MQQEGGIAAIVENHVRTIAVGPCHHLLGAPPVLLEGFTFPSKNWHAVGIIQSSMRANRDGSGSVILG